MNVELGLDQAAVALLGFGKPPGAVLEALDLRFERGGVAREPVAAAPMHRRAAERGKAGQDDRPCPGLQKHPCDAVPARAR